MRPDCPLGAPLGAALRAPERPRLQLLVSQKTPIRHSYESAAKCAAAATAVLVCALAKSIAATLQMLRVARNPEPVLCARTCSPADGTCTLLFALSKRHVTRSEGTRICCDSSAHHRQTAESRAIEPPRQGAGHTLQM